MCHFRTVIQAGISRHDVLVETSGKERGGKREKEKKKEERGGGGTSDEGHFKVKYH